MVNPKIAPASSRHHRLVRRQTFGQRIASFLNPLDNLLSISLILESYDWEGLGESIATPVGIGLNLLLMITRANSSTDSDWRSSSRAEDVLLQPGEEYGSSSGRGAFGYFMTTISYALWMLALGNAIFCLNRTKPYRLFETSIHSTPPTPSARRVRVSSSPSESSPYRFVKSMLPAMSYATSPPIVDNVTEDEVWEVAMWDPPKFNLSMLSYFSPLHATVIFLSLPYTPPPSGGLFADIPTTTYSTSRMAVIWQIAVTLTLLTVQTWVLTAAFQTQLRDSRYINSQVFSEYNKKFVAPRVNVLTRDVATSTDNRGFAEAFISNHTPGFKTHANPAYFQHTVEGGGGLFSRFMKPTTPTEAETPTHRSAVNGHAMASGVRHSSGIPTATGGSLGRSTGRKSISASDLMTPARKVAANAAGGSSRGSPASTRVPGRNGNVWGGGVDYGIQSPMRRTTRDRGI